VWDCGSWPARMEKPRSHGGRRRRATPPHGWRIYTKKIKSTVGAVYYAKTKELEHDTYGARR